MPALTTRSRIHAYSIKSSLAHAIQHQMDIKKISKADLADKMGTNRTAVRRLLDPKNMAVTLKTFAKAADALGLELTLKARRLSGTELAALAQQMVNADSEKQADQLEEQIIAGFYGTPHATSSKK